MSKKTANYNLHKPELTDPADITAMDSNWDTIDNELHDHQIELDELRGKLENTISGIPVASAYSTDGVNYVCEIPNYFETLNNGAKIIIIPSMTTTSTTPNLKLNTFDNFGIRRRSTKATDVIVNGSTPGWLVKNQPITLLFNNSYWIYEDNLQFDSNDINGVIPVDKGGTGASTAEQALKNLGLTATATELNHMDGVTSSVQNQLNGKAPMYTGGTTDMEDGVTPLETGKLYFYYEE